MLSCFLSLSYSSYLFFLCWTLFVSNLTPQAGPSTLKNFDFASTGARFSKKQGLGSADALDGVLGLSWARFGCSWGLLEGSFGAFAGSRWHPAFSKLLFGAPLNPHLAPRGASNRPKRLPRRPHGEANGPTKPPRLIWRRIWTYFPLILDPKSKKKSKREA